MAALVDITTPLTAALAALTVDGQSPRAAYLWDPDWGSAAHDRCWYVNVGEREIERHIGRYREAITFNCVYVAGDAASGRRLRLDDAAAMAQAAVEHFNSPAGLTLGSGLLVSGVAAASTGGGIDAGSTTLIASQLNLTVSRWVRYSE